MAEGGRKSLVWAIKKDLLTLRADELFQIAKSVSPVPGMDDSHLMSGDEEECFDYISSFMCSKFLLESEDSGMAHLLELKDVVDSVIQGYVSGIKPHVTSNDDGLFTKSDDFIAPSKTNSDVNVLIPSDSQVTGVTTDSADHDATTTPVATHDAELQKILASYEELSKKIMQYAPMTTHQTVPQSPAKSVPQSRCSTEHSTHAAPDKVVSLRDLSYLHRREFKIQGGQIGDLGSDISYNSICRQIDEGLKEQFSDAEITRAVLRVIKPGSFKDMLMNKDDLTVEELKDFLHSHLGEQSNTELFQELMCTKQKETETPQQFLYRVIGLKQKILLASKHANADVKYSASTVQDVFLHTVYQGLGHKHGDIRRELKPLLVDNKVTDEVILKQMKKVMSDESERQRRLGPSFRQRQANAHSVQLEATAAPCSNVKEESSTKKPKTDMIQQLTEKVEKLTSMVEFMKQSMQTQKSEPDTHPFQGKVDNRKGKPYCCDKCVEQNRPECFHCFSCGEEGHRAVGCLKRPTRQGNWSRSLSGDKQ